MIRTLYKVAPWVLHSAWAAVYCVALAGLVSLQGCSVNVVVAPNATLSLHSDLSQNAVQELERGQE